MNEFNFRVANAAPRASGSSERSGTLLVTCGDQRREVTIWQKAAEQDITLTINWPLNTFSGAFFKEGQTPQTGSTGTAYPGDRISAYRFTNQTWQLRSTFLLPSSDQIITL